MKVILAETLGFCFGVKNAVETIYNVLDKTEGSNILMDGPIIHNGNVIDDLESKGVKLLAEESKIKDKIVVVRAHGVSPKKEKDIIAAGGKIVDGTCPIVKSSQSKIVKYNNLGYFVVIAGDKGHAEVVGLVGQAPDNSVVVANINDLKNYEFPSKTVLLSQTTFSRPEYEVIEKRLKELCPNLVVLNTICNATKKRQDAVLDLAGKVDSIIVVGGLNSSNTKRLKAAVESIVPTWLIEDYRTIPEDIKKFKIVGVTAGASTPDSVINEVVKVLESY